jgi:hypoxanthine-DNA glycosylase
MFLADPLAESRTQPRGSVPFSQQRRIGRADKKIIMLQGFPPVLDVSVETAVFGSFPGEASLAAGQYYAHPRNQFWRLLGCLLDEPLPQLDYAERVQRLLARRIGIWDVLAACQRAGSLDTAIRCASPNDFARLRQLAPRLRTIGLNGKTAGRFAPLLQAAGYRTLVLPSSRPANAMLSFEQKLAAWQALIF